MNFHVSRAQGSCKLAKNKESSLAHVALGDHCFVQARSLMPAKGVSGRAPKQRSLLISVFAGSEETQCVELSFT